MEKKITNLLCFSICKDPKIQSCCMEDDWCSNNGFSSTLILLRWTIIIKGDLKKFSLSLFSVICIVCSSFWYFFSEFRRITDSINTEYQNQSFIGGRVCVCVYFRHILKFFIYMTVDDELWFYNSINYIVL